MKASSLNRTGGRTDGTKNPPGFSIIELLIAMAIVSIVLAATYGLFINYSRSNTLQSVSTDVQQDLRAAIMLMEQEIRGAGFNPRDIVGTGILIGSDATTIIFTSDNDFNGLIAQDDLTTTVDELTTSPDEWITYVYDAANRQLVRRSMEADGSQFGIQIEQTVLDNVAGFTFEYRDRDFQTIVTPVPEASLADIRSVHITIRMVRETAYGDIDRTVETRAYCRNLNL